MTGFDPYDRDFQRDPYPVYAALRAAPPFRDAGWNATFFSRHADVAGILRDRRFGRDIRHLVPIEDLPPRTYRREYPTWYRLIRGSFIDLEPPEHTRLRGLVSRSFTKGAAEGLRSSVAARAADLVEEARSAGRLDVVADFAAPIALATICDLMAIPGADRSRLLDWSHAIVRLFDLNATPDEGDDAERATRAFAGYLQPLVEARRRRPGPDLLSTMLADREGRPTADDDVIATAILTLNAGHEATVLAVGNAVLALARAPDVYERLRAQRDGDLAPAVEELLRYDAPLQMFERWVLEDLDWHGTPLRRGDKVALLFGAANRDPERFTDPDRIDLDRGDNPHLAFGAGHHLCVGAPLARIELQEALRALLRALPRIDLDDPDPPRLDSLVFRGVTALPIAV